MSGRYYEHDQEHYERPRRHTRPRTKERPTYADAVDGVVLTVDRGRFTLCVDGPHRDGHEVAAPRPQGRRRRRPGAGRRRHQRAPTGRWRGSSRSPSRETVLRRTADDDDPVERIIVANAEPARRGRGAGRPRARPRLIDRALVAAYDAGMEPVLCLTKADLADPETLLVDLSLARRPVARDAASGGDLTELRATLSGRTSVMVGHSGVGKSTLVNALVPDANRDVGHVNAVTGRGRHTSTSACMLALPGDDGWIIDTPGIRSFGLAHVEPEHLIEAFPDLDEMTEDCPRGCTHGGDEPECGLDEAVTPRRRRPRAGRVVPPSARRARRRVLALTLGSAPVTAGRRQSSQTALEPESPARKTHGDGDGPTTSRPSTTISTTPVVPPTASALHGRTRVRWPPSRQAARATTTVKPSSDVRSSSPRSSCVLHRRALELGPRLSSEVLAAETPPGPRPRRR